MPKHLLFVALTGHGHINPTLALVEELVHRGHTVDYATAPDHADSVREAGAEWVPLPAMAPFTPTGPDFMGAWFRHFFAAMRASFPVLRERCAAGRPDAICYDTTNWPARLVAHELGIRPFGVCRTWRPTGRTRWTGGFRSWPCSSGFPRSSPTPA